MARTKQTERKSTGGREPRNPDFGIARKQYGGKSVLVKGMTKRDTARNLKWNDQFHLLEIEYDKLGLKAAQESLDRLLDKRQEDINRMTPLVKERYEKLKVNLTRFIESLSDNIEDLKFQREHEIENILGYEFRVNEAAAAPFVKVEWKNSSPNDKDRFGWVSGDDVRAGVLLKEWLDSQANDHWSKAATSKELLEIEGSEDLELQTGIKGRNGIKINSLGLTVEESK